MATVKLMRDGRLQMTHFTSGVLGMTSARNSGIRTRLGFK